MNPETINKLLTDAFPDSEISVQGDDGHHFEAKIISKLFAGKSRVEQQRLVYAVLEPYIASGELHAISLKTQIKD